jgi:hypothetical protein
MDSQWALNQTVRIVSGVYCHVGKVVEITSTGIAVQITGIPAGWFRFDSDGNGCDGQHTFECGPWYIEH